MSSYKYSSKDIKDLMLDAHADRHFCRYFSFPIYKDVTALVCSNSCEELEDYGDTVEKFLERYTKYLRNNFEKQSRFSNEKYFEKYEVEICDIEDDDGVGSIIDTRKNWLFYEWKDAERKFNDIIDTLDVVGANNIGVYINVYLYDKETLLPKGVNPNGTLDAEEYLPNSILINSSKGVKFTI